MCEHWPPSPPVEMSSCPSKAVTLLHLNLPAIVVVPLGTLARVRNMKDLKKTEDRFNGLNRKLYQGRMINGPFVWGHVFYLSICVFSHCCWKSSSQMYIYQLHDSGKISSLSSPLSKMGIISLGWHKYWEGWISQWMWKDLFYFF